DCPNPAHSPALSTPPPFVGDERVSHPSEYGRTLRLPRMSDGVIERYLHSLVTHDWPAFEACLADEFTRVGPYQDTYASKADYVAFLSGLMPRLAGYKMEVGRVSYADGVAYAELAETV